MEENARIMKSIDDIKFSLEETLAKLEEIWINIGLTEEQKEQRCQTINSHVQDLLYEMLTEECALEAKLQVKISEYEKELEQLYNDLQEVSPGRTELKLAELEAKLRHDVDTLNKKKYDRLKCLRRLRDDEMELCEYLVMPQVDMNFIGCPKQEQLRELEQHIVFLKAEKIARTEVLEKYQKSIVTLWTQMDIGPANESEFQLLNGTVSSLPKNYIDSLEQLNTKLNEDYVSMLQKIEDQRQKFTLLWKTLKDKIHGSDNISIQEPPVENTVHTLKILNTNIEQLNILKKQHLEKFIIAIQNELVCVWDKCFFGEEQRKNCLAYYTEEFTEESLEYHECELNVVKEHYEVNKELYKLIVNREALWEEKIKLENNTVENLLNTRGGALLKSLNRKQRIAKQLPKLDKELSNRISVWEMQNCKSFMFKDQTYLEHIEMQKAQHGVEEKLKRDQKQLAKKKELSEEMHYGSTTKRKCITPTHTPTRSKAKFARMDSTLMNKGNSNNRSAFGNLNNTHAVYRSPAATKVKHQLPKYSKPVNLGNNKGTPNKVNEKNTSMFTHSSLKKARNENKMNKKKNKVINSKLSTEWSKKRRSRRSIKGNSVLKEICLNLKPETCKDVNNTCYDDFASGVGMDAPFSSSSVIKPDLVVVLTPEVSIIGGNDVN